MSKCVILHANYDVWRNWSISEPKWCMGPKWSISEPKCCISGPNEQRGPARQSLACEWRDVASHGAQAGRPRVQGTRPRPRGTWALAPRASPGPSGFRRSAASKSPLPRRARRRGSRPHQPPPLADLVLEPRHVDALVTRATTPQLPSCSTTRLFRPPRRRGALGLDQSRKKFPHRGAPWLEPRICLSCSALTFAAPLCGLAFLPADDAP